MRAKSTIDAESIIAMEKMAELQKEISKQLRGNDDRMSLMEELADVWICLKFLQGIFLPYIRRGNEQSY